MVLFDEPLSPVQGRNLNRILGVKVLDRVELILDIFASRARTREAKIQVELAQLQYLLPRLARMWLHLSRQEGGIGTRGPGETQLEIDRRRIREKIQVLGSKLKMVRKNRDTQRRERSRKNYFHFSLVGYTNAGKSTLFNHMTRSTTLVRDQLFCTLDSLSRSFDLLDTYAVLLTDTVGFVRKLPHFLVESFMATLEEVQEADCLVHVLDASAGDIREKNLAVVHVLRDELGMKDVPTISVLNKSDCIAPGDLDHLMRLFPDAVVISAKTGEGIDALKERMKEVLLESHKTCHFFFPMDQLGTAGALFEKSMVIEQEYTEKGLAVVASVDEKTRGILSRFEVENFEQKETSNSEQG